MNYSDIYIYFQLFETLPPYPRIKIIKINNRNTSKQIIIFIEYFNSLFYFSFV